MLRRIASFAFAIAALSATAKADERSEAMLQQFFAQLDGAEGWSAAAGAIASDGDDTIADAIVITREAQPVTEIRIERLRLRDLGERDGGGFTASEIELTNAGMTGADAGFRMAFEYAIPTATMTDVSMPAFAGLEYDPSRLMTFWARFYALAAEGEFAELAVPTMTESLRSVGTVDLGTSLTEYADIRLSGLGDGILASQTNGATIVTGTGPDGAFELRLESSGAEGFSLAGFAHIFDETQYADGRGDDAWQPVIARLYVSNLSLDMGDAAAITLADFSVENLEGRQSRRPFTNEWNRLLDPSVPEAAKANLALDAMAEMSSDWRAGGIALAGLGIEAPSENISFSLGEMTFAGLSNEGFDSFRLASLAGSGPATSSSLASLDISGFVFPDFEALRAFAALENDVDTQTHADVVLQAIAGLPRLDHVGLSGLSAGQSAENTISLASASLDMADWNDIWAGSTDLRIDDLLIPGALLRQNPEAARVMDMMSFDSLVMDYAITDRWDPSQGTDDFSLGIFVQDVFDIELSHTLNGMTAAWLAAMTADAGKTENSHAALAKMMDGLSLERVTIRATDRSLLDRAFTVAAEMQGLSVDGAAYRQQMRGALPFLLSTVIPPELAKTISPPLQEFLGGGKTLVADLTPAAPLPVTELIAAAESDPTSLPALLGLEMRAEDAE